MPGAGVEPARTKGPRDFKSHASTIPPARLEGIVKWECLRGQEVSELWLSPYGTQHRWGRERGFRDGPILMEYPTESASCSAAARGASVRSRRRRLGMVPLAKTGNGSRWGNVCILTRRTRTIRGCLERLWGNIETSKHRYPIARGDGSTDTLPGRNISWRTPTEVCRELALLGCI